MYKIFTGILLIMLALPFGIETVYGQTEVHGVLLSTDGEPMPATVISIRQADQADIFARYDPISADEDGSYRLTLNAPGIYNITFRGVYHQGVTIPVLITNQPVIRMDVVLLPVFFNDGRYFENEEYLSWIRVVGDFNDYDFNTGSNFSLNDDGSISAFIPVTADTVRFQVRGLSYGRGGSATPIPPLDEINIHPNNSFEAVRYRDLPDDSLEVRFIPGESIPYQRYLPSDDESIPFTIRGIISLHEESDRHWIWPLELGFFGTTLHIAEGQDITAGISPEDQIAWQAKYQNDYRGDKLMERKRSALTYLEENGLDSQQKGLLHMAYAATVYRLNGQQRLYDQQRDNAPDGMEIEVENIPDFEINTDVIVAIPDLISPSHPAWARFYGISQLLLEESSAGDEVLRYLHQIVEYHPDELVVQRILADVIRYLAPDYQSVEEMEVYRVVVERFGEGDAARQAHRVFQSAD